jgi:hypothetical protein
MRWRRTRRVLEWIGLAVMIITPFAWVLSLTEGVHCRSGWWTASVDDGALTVWHARPGARGYAPENTLKHFPVNNHSRASLVPMLVTNSGPFQWIVRVPAWTVLVLAVVATLALLRLDRPERWRRAGRCFACGYDRRGIAPESPCPECGAAPVPTASGAI